MCMLIISLMTVLIVVYGAVWSGSTLFAEEASESYQQTSKQTTFVVIGALWFNITKLN